MLDIAPKLFLSGVDRGRKHQCDDFLRLHVLCPLLQTNLNVKRPVTAISTDARAETISTWCQQFVREPAFDFLHVRVSTRTPEQPHDVCDFDRVGNNVLTAHFDRSICEERELGWHGRHVEHCVSGFIVGGLLD